MTPPAWLVGVSFALVGYVTVGTDKGVTVYRHDGGAEINLAGEGDIDAPPERVRAALLDYARHPAIVHGVAVSRVLERGSDSMLVYQRLDLPLISDRDFTLRVRWGAEGATLWTRFTAENEHGPAPEKGVVRITLHEGGWRLLPINGGRGTHAFYQFRMDLGGMLPRWMGRSRAGKEIPALFEAFRREVR